MNNCFNKPRYYRNELLKYRYFQTDISDKYQGKSLMYAFLTRFCYCGCEFCFNRSQLPQENCNISDQFSERGIENLIKFCEKANLGCLIISGGGDPFIQKDNVLKLVERAKADRIVLVTSGFWAKNIEQAEKVIKEVYSAYKARKQKCQLVIRISISSYHAKALGIGCALNVVKIFDKAFRSDENFLLQLKTFDNDHAFEEFLKNLDFQNISDPEENVSDNLILEKILRKRSILTLKSGFKIIVGFSEIFYTSVLPDLNTKSTHLDHVVKTVEDDLNYSVRKSPATILNKDGKIGLNWSLYYNGNLCLWQSQARDTYQNIYEDDFDHAMFYHFNDPLIVSFVEKGSDYRDAVIREISPRAVYRAKATGLRDRLGLYLLDDERTRLYYMIRSIQDFIDEGEIQKDCLKSNPELSQMIKLDKEELIKLYKESTYDMLQQEFNRPFDEFNFHDFLCLIKLKHFDLSESRVNEAINYYNTNTKNPKIKTLDDIKSREDCITYKRIGDRQMSIKTSLIAYK